MRRVNRILYAFGWAIVVTEAGDATAFYAIPKRARRKTLGFPQEVGVEKWRKFAEEVRSALKKFRKEIQ